MSYAFDLDKNNGIRRNSAEESQMELCRSFKVLIVKTNRVGRLLEASQNADQIAGFSVCRNRVLWVRCNGLRGNVPDKYVGVALLEE